MQYAPGAYVASYTSSQPLLKARRGEATTELLEGCGQKFPSLQIDLAAAARLVDATARLDSLREEARLASLSLPYAGTWLNVVPRSALGLHLRGPEFTTAVKYRLGAEIFSSAGPCPACSAYSDSLGDHALCCRSAGERVSSRVSQNTQFSLYLNCLWRDFVLT